MSQGLEAKRRKMLVQYLLHLPAADEDLLATLKRRAASRRRDPVYLWEALISALSTLGNARGYDGLVTNRGNFERVSFEVLDSIDPRRRERHIEAVLRDAKVRMPVVKAGWLARNFAFVKELGGPREATALARRQRGSEAKRLFMRQFLGIGEKYARDTWMDSHDPDFRDCIALDVRVLKVSALLGFAEADYAAHERLYQKLAREAGRETWEVDRLCFHRNKEIVGLLKSAGTPTAKRAGAGPRPKEGFRPPGRSCR